MKTKILYPKNIWFNKPFRSLDTTSRVVCLYLVTNDNIGLIRTYKQHDLELCFILSLKETQLEKIKADIEETGLFYFKDEWVYINNDFSYVDYQGRDRLMEAKQKETDNVPSYIAEHFEQVIKGLKTGYKPPINNKYKIINTNTKEEGKKYSNLEHIEIEDLVEIANQLNVSLVDVQKKYDEMIDAVLSKPKKYKYENYKAALRNWVRRSMDEGKIKKLPPQAQSVLSKYKDIPEEEKIEGLKRLAEIRSKYFGKKEVKENAN